MRLASCPLLVAWIVTACVADKPLSRPTASVDLDGIRILDPQGQNTSLAALRRPVTLMAYWATFCEPCIKELPALERLQKKLAADEDVRILAINVDEADESDAKLQALLHQHAPDLKLYRDIQGVGMDKLAEKAGQKRALPMLILIDAKGDLGIRTGFRLVSEEERSNSWLKWMDIAREGRLAKWQKEQLESIRRAEQPVNKAETVRLKLPKDLPPEKLDALMKALRKGWQKRHPYLSEQEMDTIMQEVREQVAKSEEVEIEIPGATEKR